MRMMALSEHSLLNRIIAFIFYFPFFPRRGIVFHIRYEEFLTIGTLITVGLVIETVNTAIEETCDAIDEAFVRYQDS